MAKIPMGKALESTFISTGLTCSHGSIEDGGYVKNDNMVIVNLRMKGITASSGATITISGFPTYSGKNRVAVASNGAGNYIGNAVLRTDGVLQADLLRSMSNDGQLFSTVYICS